MACISDAQSNVIKEKIHLNLTINLCLFVCACVARSDLGKKIGQVSYL